MSGRICPTCGHDEHDPGICVRVGPALYPGNCNCPAGRSPEVLPSDAEVDVIRNTDAFRDALFYVRLQQETRAGDWLAERRMIRAVITEWNRRSPAPPSVVQGTVRLAQREAALTL